jgi:GntR family transcriptional regulator, transcriptional repressor for pyruvate dehydrogenase complex
LLRDWLRLRLGREAAVINGQRRLSPAMPDAPSLGGRLVPSANLTEELIKRLSAEIESGRLSPGDKLPAEHEIMTSAGVSRTVVREAIAALRAQGLVITRQGAGAFVAAASAARPFRIDPEEMESLAEVVRIMELRLSIETEAAGLAAERRTSAQLAEIAKKLKALDRAIRKGENAVEDDFAFHKAILAASDNPYFLRFLEFLGRYIIPRRTVSNGVMGTAEERRTYLERIQAEHVLIHDTIKARDPEAARLAMRRHLGNSLERYRALMARRDGKKARSRLVASAG